MVNDNLLKITEDKKKNNPKFIRQDTHKKKRLDKIWRKPRGLHSKLREQRSHRKIVKPGYGLPSEFKGKTNGKTIVFISKANELSKVDTKKEVCIISGRIGMKSRLAILEQVVKLKINIINIADPEKYLEDKKKQFEERKKKEKAPKKAALQTAKPESIDEKIDEDEKKKLEKKEIDRLLTKKFDKK
ncbi:MAG: eL32 family ribosomal protein [archaeon]